MDSIDEKKEPDYEITRPTLDASDVQADEVMAGKMYMVKPGAHFRFPIHPAPGADHKIAKLLRQSEVIVVSSEEDSNNEYLRTVLPITGWVRKACIDEGMLVEVTKGTYGELVNLHDDDDIASCCDKCLRNCGCLRGCYTSIRKHPVYLFAIYNLLHLLAQGVIFFDFITDLLVASVLADAQENWLFMLTVVFMLAPYYIAWAAVFGELQKIAMASTARRAERAMKSKAKGHATDASDLDDVPIKDDDNEPSDSADNEEQVTSSAPDKKIQFGVIMFAIAPIGVCMLVMVDIYLFFEDLLIKPVYLWLFKSPLRTESHTEKGYKKLRRVSEVVAETICQAVLQAGIVLFWGGGIPDLSMVYLSLVTSVLVLVLWSVVLRREASEVGLRTYEYVTVILQGSFNFVPYLPAIERGKKDLVNWADFRFDSHSVGLVSKALISPDCELRQIKLSADSLRKLTHHECKFLGQMLADSPKDSVKVVFSRSRKEIEDLFKRFDRDNSRTFDFFEFVQLCTALRQNDDGVVSAQDVADIFLKLADAQRHEVYLTDLLIRIGQSEERLPVLDYDSPVMYALKTKDQNLLTFMMAAKVCDDATFEYYTTTLVTTNRHQDALMMTEEKGVPLVVEVLQAADLPAHNADATSDPYASVSVSDKVKRTETMFKTLAPTWNQPLLFVLPPEDIPQITAGLLAHGATMLNGPKPSDKTVSSRAIDAGMSAKRRAHRGASRAPQDELRRRKSHHPNHQRHAGGGKKGVVGSTSSRLEINFKIYDYEEQDDDFYLGAYKHLIDWNTRALSNHQEGSNMPRMFTKELNNHGKGGRFSFRIYTGTLQYYIKWGRAAKGLAGKSKKKKKATMSVPMETEPHVD